MENENEQVQSTNTREDVLMPSGLTEDMDFFEWAESVANETDEPQQTSELLDTVTPAEEENGTEESEEAPTTGSEAEEDGESGAETGELPITQDQQEVQPTKIRFDANINHKVQSIELDQSQLPEIYQKAYAADKYRNKLNSKNAEMEQAEVVAKILGYDSVKAMLDAAEKSYEDTEIQRLTNEKVHPDIAKDTVTRKIKEIRENVTKNRKPVQQEQEQTAEVSQQTAPGTRNFLPEAVELLGVYPELKGKALPEEVVEAAHRGERLITAYAKYIKKQTKADNDRLQKENKTLKQNAEAAKRAPVRGVAKGGATGEQAEDPFLKGFNSYFESR